LGQLGGGDGAENSETQDGTIFAAAHCLCISASAPHEKENVMLGWALTFLIVALVAAVLGFGGIAGASASIAQMLFFVFILLFIVAMIARALRGKPPL
jgi:uncharacterized membrane protein YtjA (UPF0391 family)